MAAVSQPTHRDVDDADDEIGHASGPCVAVKSGTYTIAQGVRDRMHMSLLHCARVGRGQRPSVHLAKTAARPSPEWPYGTLIAVRASRDRWQSASQCVSSPSC
eukprot:5911153-Pleurochrysis_carterae.AAC.6